MGSTRVVSYFCTAFANRWHDYLRRGGIKMATEYNRQYVGARYVQKLFDDGQGGMSWQPNTYYEALTQVTYNNVSYVSRVPVSSNIGAPPENTQFWINMGGFNAQVSSLQDKVIALENQVNDIILKNSSYFKGRYFLLIGDSYGTGYTPEGNITGWCELVRNDIIAMGGQCDINPVFGAGWIKDGNTYLMAYNASQNKNKYTDIIIGGGYNDADISRDNLYAAMKSFSLAVSTGSPNAKVFFANIGEDSKDSTKRGRLAIIDGWLPGSGTSIQIVPHAFECLHSIDCFSSDRFHPSSIGQQQLRFSFIQFLCGGPFAMYTGSGFYSTTENGKIIAQTSTYNTIFIFYPELNISLFENYRAGTEIVITEDIANTYPYLMPNTFDIDILKVALVQADNVQDYYQCLLSLRQNKLTLRIFTKPYTNLTNVTSFVWSIETGAYVISAKYL